MPPNIFKSVGTSYLEFGAFYPELGESTGKGNLEEKNSGVPLLQAVSIYGSTLVGISVTNREKTATQ